MNEDFEQQIESEVARIAELDLAAQPDEFNRLRELLESELDSPKSN